MKFYTLAEFREIINCYVNKLNEHLSECKETENRLEEWEENVDWKTYQASIQNNGSYLETHYHKEAIKSAGTLLTAEAYFKTFKMYIDHLGQYADKLGHKDLELSEAEIEAQELVEYVSYYKNTADAKNGKNGTYTALAVKHVYIDWPLQFSRGSKEVENVSLVDSMGIGEAKFMVEDALLESMKTRADLAIALIYINKKKYEADSVALNTHFLKVLSKVSDRKLCDWVYYLANIDKSKVASLTEEVLKTYREDLWSDMTKSADAVALNSDYWRPIPFLSHDDTPNDEALRSYFRDTVLANLGKSISEVDKYFKTQLQEELKGIKEQYEALKNKLHEAIAKLPEFTDEETKYKVDKKVSEVMTKLSTSLNKARKDIAKTEKDKREKILEEIKPLLQEPATFEVVGSDQGPSNQYTDTVKKSLANNGIDVLGDCFCNLITTIDWAICDNIKSSVKEECQVTRIEQNLKDCKTIIVNEAIQSTKGKNTKGIVLSENLNEGTTLENNLTSCLEIYYDKAINCVMNLFEDIRPQTDSDNLDDCNLVGRELYCYYRNREKIYDTIMKRFALGGKCAAITQEDINEVKSKIISKIKADLKTYYPVDNKEDAEWLRSFAASLPKAFRELKADLNAFLDSTIDLSVVVGRHMGQKKRKVILNVSLDYTEELTAAAQFWASLSLIDSKLRKLIYESYEETFRTGKVFDQEIVRPLLNNVFNFHVHASDTHTESYVQLMSYLSQAINNQLSKSDDSLCKLMADELRSIMM